MLCDRCGYDRTGISKNAPCPECGGAPPARVYVRPAPVWRAKTCRVLLSVQTPVLIAVCLAKFGVLWSWKKGFAGADLHSDFEHVYQSMVLMLFIGGVLCSIIGFSLLGTRVGRIAGIALLLGLVSIGWAYLAGTAWR